MNGIFTQPKWLLIGLIIGLIANFILILLN